MAIVLSLILFFTLLGVITYFGYRRYARPARVYEQLGGEANYSIPLVDQRSPAEPGLAVKVFEIVGENVPINPEDASLTRRDLTAAGYRSERALTIYLAVRVIAVAALLLAALVLRGYVPGVADNTVLSVVFIVAAGVIG